MKKRLLILTVLSVILNIGLVYVFLIKGETVKSSDNRTAIVMTEGNADFVLTEMRDFLESVQQINDGIIQNDPKKIIEAGKKSGGSVIEHAPNGLIKTLPLSFKKLGFKTHDLFDEIKAGAESDFGPKRTQIQLSQLLSNCIACHSSFKIETLKN
jgi:hypothetical protein